MSIVGQQLTRSFICIFANSLSLYVDYMLFTGFPALIKADRIGIR